MRTLRKVLVITWKDIISELRARRTVPIVLVFALLAMVIFNFAFGENPEVVRLIAPGIIWTTFVFAGMLALSRSFVLEMEDGSLEGLIACPVGRHVIYLGKMLGSLVFMLIIEAAVLVAFALIFNVATFSLEFLVVVLLVTVGLVASGTLFSALAANTKTRELTLPVLFLPIAVPLLISAVRASGLAISGESWSSLIPWIEIIAAFDVTFLVASILVFDFVIEE